MISDLEFPNGISLQLVLAGARFLGIGRVTHRGTALRAEALPWTLTFESDMGARFVDFSLIDVEHDAAGAVTIVLSAIASHLTRSEEADAMGDSRIRTRRLAPALATVRWCFRPVTEHIHEAVWEGVAWSIAVDSPGHPLHWLLEASTWEIGGEAEGCTLIQRDMSTIWPEQPVTRHGAFSTIEKFAIDASWGGSFPMDMMPRCAGSSHLDFQIKGDCAIVLFTEKPSLSRARIDKFADENVIHYLDRPFFPLGIQVQAPERKLLVHRSQAPMVQHEHRNLWLDVQADVRDRILTHYGFMAEVPTPTVSAHLWDPELKRLGKSWSTPLIELLPQVADLGYRAVSTHGVWESSTSDPQSHEGNICCPYEFRFADMFGGNAGMKRLIALATAQGLDVFQWFSNHLSKDAPIFKTHPEWVLKEADGNPYDASYHVLWTGRMRSGWGAELERQVLAVRRETGLSGIFWDSFHNLGVTAVDWGAPDKAPQADEIFRMCGRLQAAGYRGQRPETITIFGCGQAAVYGFADDRFRRRLWSDTVANDDIFALTDSVVCYFTEGDACATGKLTSERYFWMAAHRVLTSVGADPWNGTIESSTPSIPGGIHAHEFGRINRIYNAALPGMKRMRLAAKGDYVLWLDETNRPSSIWAFRDAEVPYSGKAEHATDEVSVMATVALQVKAGDVWFLNSSTRIPSATEACAVA